jgi:hypothetical protein
MISILNRTLDLFLFFLSFIHYSVQLARLNFLLWLSIRLFLLSQVFTLHLSLPLTCHFPKTKWHWLRPILTFLQPYVYFTLADPAMPISPTYVAAGYPLCKPLCKPLLFLSELMHLFVAETSQQPISQTTISAFTSQHRCLRTTGIHR